LFLFGKSDRKIKFLKGGEQIKSLEKTLNNFLNKKLIYCDIGSGPRGAIEPWSSYRSLFHQIGFEADNERFDTLKARKSENETILNYAIYSENKKVNFNLAKNVEAYSILPPNMEFHSKFPEADRCEQTKVVPLQAVTLDSLYQKKIICSPDFAKIIVNGAEMDVLIGGRKALGHVLGIQIAIEFEPFWKGESTFPEIDFIIRKDLGLEIQDIRKYHFKYREGVGYGGKKGKLAFCDALYFRSPEGVLDICRDESKEKAYNSIVMACVMSMVYGYADYPLHLLNLPDVKNYLSDHDINELLVIIKEHFKELSLPSFPGKGKLAEVIAVLNSLFTSYNGWKLKEHTHLGLKKKFSVFY
jgi:FkbM family methyltransferase